MRDNPQRLHHLALYRSHLSHELDQMGYSRNQLTGQGDTSPSRSRSAGIWAVVASMLLVAGMALAQTV